jgi:hypothetical protein
MFRPQHIIFGAILFLFCLRVDIVAASPKEIHLKDGSKIVGELVSFNQGVYTVKTENLGTVQLAESDVVSVLAEAAPQTAVVNSVVQPQGEPSVDMGALMASNPEFAQQIASVQGQISQNPDMMQAVQGLTQDPEVVALVSDPAFVSELMAAMNQGDPQAIANNPKVQKLLNNPNMRAAMQKIQGSALPPQQ